MRGAFFKIIIYLLISSILLACSGDENVDVEGPIASCFDGIMNGSEEGIDCGGTCVIVCPPSDKLEGDIVGTLELNASVEYLVTGPVLVRDKAKLLIPAGTVIKVESGINAYIAVAQGGQIFANGQSENPIVITSNAANPAPGDWGGLIISGKAPINTSTVDRTELIDIFYGGTVVDDSSGFIKYLRIEYAGAQFDASKKFNGISLYGVGAFTTFNYVQTAHCLGDGFKLIGGTIKPKWLVSTNTNENGLHITDGWNGMVDLLYIAGSEKAGIRIANNTEIEDLSPITNGTIQNSTILGPLTDGAITYANGGAIATFNNIYTSGITLGINVSGELATSQVEMNNLTISNIQFDNPSSGFSPTNHSGTNTTFYMEADNVGAGNRATIPIWATGWTIGF